MPIDASVQMLHLIANPIRKSIIQSLEGTSMFFAEVMRASGLDPNFDTGPFSYHLSVLLDSRIVEKVDNMYQLTGFGNTIANIVGILKRESKFLLETDEVSKGGERMAGKIEYKWLCQADLLGQYGLILGPPGSVPPEKWERPEDKVFDGWEKELPQLDMPPPSFFGYVIGFEKDGIKLGSIRVRFSKKSLDGTRRAEVLGIFTKDNDYREAGITRGSMLQKMIEEFLRQVKEHKTQSVELEKVDAEDEELVMVLKEFGFERYQTTYAMQKTI